MAAAVAVAGLGHAQSFIEGFEPGPATPGVAAVPAGWTSVNNSVGGPGTNPNWQVRNDGAVFPSFNGATYAFANFNSATGANDISNYLISPLVTLNNGDTISFYTRTIDTPGFADRLELVYNTTGSTLPADFTNVLLTVNPTLSLAGYPTTWTQFTATITGLAGPTSGRFAFHYNPTNGGPLGLNSDYVGIDDVSYIALGDVLASNEILGSGCGGSFNSFYQQFADAASASAALSGNALQLIPTGNGYVGIWLPGAAAALYVTPVMPVTLATGDDGAVAVTPSISLSTPYGPQGVLQVSGNGIIGFGAGALDFPGTNSFTPTPEGFLDGTNGGFYSWHDYNETEGGDVQSEEIGGVLYITYNNVESYANPEVPNPSTLQFQLDLATGLTTIVWLSIDSNSTSIFGSGHLIGVSAPGLSLDPGSVNLATASLLSSDPEAADLTLNALNRPVQLAGPNSWNLEVTGLNAGDIVVDIIGFSDPNILDLSLLGFGQAGCQWRASLDLTGASLATGPTRNWSLPIPGGAPSAVGTVVFLQNAVVSPTLNLSLTKTSNGIRGTVGNF